MERIKIDSDRCEISRITSIFMDGKNPITFHFFDIFENQTTLIMDEIGANAIRIAIASLKNIPPLCLPKNPEGELQCSYLKVHYVRTNDGVEFEKELGESEPLGCYTTIDDGLIVYVNDGLITFCFNCEESALEKDHLAVILPDNLVESMKLQLDEIFPFNRFGKRNRLSYGYFKSIHSEKGE